MRLQIEWSSKNAILGWPVQVEFGACWIGFTGLNPDDGRRAIRCVVVEAVRLTHYNGVGFRAMMKNIVDEVDQKPRFRIRGESISERLGSQVFFLRVKPRRRPNGVCGTVPVVGDVGADDFSAVD